MEVESDDRLLIVSRRSIRWDQVLESACVYNYSSRLLSSAAGESLEVALIAPAVAPSALPSSLICQFRSSVSPSMTAARPLSYGASCAQLVVYDTRRARCCSNNILCSFVCFCLIVITTINYLYMLEKDFHFFCSLKFMGLR